MRADRLLAILMLLQARGRMTARALADELEVSERTIYRDVDALSMAGVPVYTERGPGGGCALLDEYRTTLTGLNEAEVRALFMLSIPAQLDELGFSGELKAALRKLAAALPGPQREHETRVRQRLHLDSAPWSHSAEPTPFLHRLHQAVWEDRRVRLTYRIFSGQRLTRDVAPYGLVAKNGVWHLICGGEAGPLTVVQVSRITAVEVLAQPFSRPPGFDLAAFWQAWCARVSANRATYPVTLRVAPALRPHLPEYFGPGALAGAAPPDAAGWQTLTLHFEHLEEARMRLLALGRAVEVVEPLALRLSLVDFARQIVDFYASGEAPD